MTSTISFGELSISSNRVDVCASTSDASYDLWFEFSDDIPVSTTTVAIALSTLCGRKFKRITYDFPVSPAVFRFIYELTLADVSACAEAKYSTVKRRGNLLSFSGGFDSMAARALMPSETQLVSMDFGGRFTREREFFEKFDTLRVSTNVVDTPLRLNSWSFMGIGAILAADYFGAAYHTFGGILEAGSDNMRFAPVAARNNTFPPFRGAGYINAPYVLGLTEIGTLTAMLSTTPHLVSESLSSVASPGEEKLYRKALLAQTVADTLGMKIDLPKIKPPAQPHFEFGRNFAIDLLSLYVISVTNDPMAQGMARNIPQNAVRLAERLDLSFMRRANPTHYEYFPASLAPQLNQKLAECNIRWYTEKDWGEYARVRDFLQTYHPVLSL